MGLNRFVFALFPPLLRDLRTPEPSTLGYFPVSLLLQIFLTTLNSKYYQHFGYLPRSLHWITAPRCAFQPEYTLNSTYQLPCRKALQGELRVNDKNDFEYNGRSGKKKPKNGEHILSRMLIYNNEQVNLRLRWPLKSFWIFSFFFNYFQRFDCLAVIVSIIFSHPEGSRKVESKRIKRIIILGVTNVLYSDRSDFLDCDKFWRNVTLILSLTPTPTYLLFALKLLKHSHVHRRPQLRELGHNKTSKGKRIHGLPDKVQFAFRTNTSKRHLHRPLISLSDIKRVNRDLLF